MTEHYSRGQLAGETQAGFWCYRPTPTRFGLRTPRGGEPADPRTLQWLG